jgi:hypothetical protein
MRRLIDVAGCAIASRPCGVGPPNRASTRERGKLACYSARRLRPSNAKTVAWQRGSASGNASDVVVARREPK